MIKTLMLVPIRDNEGRPFDRVDWAELESRLISWGWSRRTGTVGGWRDNQGKLRTERNREYTVAIDSWFELPQWLDIIKWTRERFRQEEIYFDVSGVPETFGGP